MVKFAVLGLPRSATTWLANWLSTDGVLCLHDPFQRALPENWPKGVGISCTGTAIMPAFLRTLDCPIAIIDRDPDECAASLEAAGYPAIPPGVLEAFRRAPGIRFPFASLWHEHGAATLWHHLRPDAPFDVLRYRELRNMRVTPIDVTPDEDILRELVSRGWLNPEHFEEP